MTRIRNKKIELKPRHELFAQLIAHGFGQSESAKLARYSENSAHVTANRLLKKANISNRIAQIQAGIAVKLDDMEIMAADKVLQEITESACAKQGIATKAGYELHIGDKLKALELMGKHHKLFADRVVLEADMGHEPPTQEELDRAVESSKARLAKHTESRLLDGPNVKKDKADSIDR
jgi:hypothetical protein